MKQSFSINLIFLVIINLIIKLSYLFIIEVGVQNSLGPSEYGIFLALFNFSYLFYFLQDPGIHNYNLTRLSKDRSLIKKDFKQVVVIKAGLGVLFFLVVIVCGFLMDYSAKMMELLKWISINHFLASSFMYLRSHHSASGRYFWDSCLSILDKSLMILFIGYLLYNKDAADLSIITFVQAQMMAFLIAIAVALISLKSIWSFPTISRTFVQAYLKQALPFGLIVFLMAVYSRIDVVMLERMLENGDYQSGIYAASYRFYEGCNMVAYLYAALLLPMFASAKIPMVHTLLDTSIRMMIPLLLGVGIIGIGWGNEIMGIYKVNNPQYAFLLNCHVGAFFCVAISYIYGTLLTAKRVLKTLNTILIAGLVFNVVMNYILIPKYAASGAAIATLSTQFIVVLCQVIVVHKKFNRQIDFNLISRVLLLSTVLSVAAIYLQPRGLNIGIDVIIIGTGVLVGIFTLGIIRKDMIFALYNKREV